MQRIVRRQATPAQPHRRWGTATVEFAVTAPLFMAILLGIVEMSRALDVKQRLSNAVREGARAAASDLRVKLPPGVTMNQKIVGDIRNMLTAGGLSGSDVDVQITFAEGSKKGTTFDLSDKDNELGYFEVTATVPYAKVGVFPVRIMKGKSLSANVVFRMGKSELSG